MNILICYWDITVGGVQHMTVKLSNELIRRGHNVTLLLAFRSPGNEPYALDPLLDVRDLKTKKVRQYFAGLANFLKANQNFDVLFTATTVPNMAALAARLLTRAKIPVIISERDSPYAGYLALNSVSEKILWSLKPLIYRLANVIVCVSTPLAQSLAKYTSIPQNRLTVIHNPAAPVRITANSQPPEILHPWFSSTEPDPVIIAAGRMHPQKDFGTLIRAFEILCKKRGAKLILLGDGQEREKLESLVDCLNLTDRVHFAGMQKDIMPWLEQSDVFVMSSLYEGFGNVLVQALAAGCQIVSTDCPDGPAEVLESGNLGRLTPISDPGAMSEAICHVLDHPFEVERLKEASKAYSIETIADKYEQVFLGAAINGR